jgi:hypothetical protein
MIAGRAGSPPKNGRMTVPCMGLFYRKSRPAPLGISYD